jgi:RsiW-degrading membrane proteinase PrsW (M82 family)
MNNLLALLVGFVPSLIWLAFWLQADRKHHEPFRLLLVCFFLGAFSVLLAKYAEESLRPFIANFHTQLLFWAAIEELLKFLVFFFVAYNSPYDSEAIEPAIYLIVTALGFAALENILYVAQPSIMSSTAAILMTGGLRFFGSTLLHTVSSGFIGIIIGVTAKKFQPVAIVGGLIGAVLLHAGFNYLVFSSTTDSLMLTYFILLIAAFVSHSVLEKLSGVSWRTRMKKMTTGFFSH